MYRSVKQAIGCVPATLAAVAAFAASPESAAPGGFVHNTTSTLSASAALVPLCSTDKSGSGDGVPTNPGSKDDKGNMRLDPAALTTPGQPDLTIGRANGSLGAGNYRLSFCVLNRGGKPAFSPIAVAVRVGDSALQDLTILTPIPSLHMKCFGSATQLAIPAGTPSLTGATIQVAAGVGETAVLNNQCRIDWNR